MRDRDTFDRTLCLQQKNWILEKHEADACCQTNAHIQTKTHVFNEKPCSNHASEFKDHAQEKKTALNKKTSPQKAKVCHQKKIWQIVIPTAILDPGSRKQDQGPFGQAIVSQSMFRRCSCTHPLGDGRLSDSQLVILRILRYSIVLRNESGHCHPRYSHLETFSESSCNRR